MATGSHAVMISYRESKAGKLTMGLFPKCMLLGVAVPSVPSNLDFSVS